MMRSWNLKTKKIFQIMSLIDFLWEWEIYLLNSRNHYEGFFLFFGASKIHDNFTTVLEIMELKIFLNSSRE